MALYLMYKFYNNFNPGFKQIKHTVHDKFTQLSGVITNANEVILYAVTVITIFRFCSSLMDAAPAMACIN